MVQKEIEKKFETLAKQAEGLNKQIESFVPYAIVKEATAFGNSAHVVLSRNFLNKRVGVIVFAEGEK